MSSQTAKLSADLRRTAYWLYDNQISCAHNTLSRCISLYKNVDLQIGCYKNIRNEIKNIIKEKNCKKASEKALTLSIILNQS